MSDEKKKTPLTGGFYLGGKRLDTSDPETLEYVRSRFAADGAHPLAAVAGALSRVEQRLDSTWIAGAQFGYMAGEANDQVGFDAAIDARRRDIREAAADERVSAVTHSMAVKPGFDRTRETPRRQQAVEKLLALGWTYHYENGWTAPTSEQAGEEMHP